MSKSLPNEREIHISSNEVRCKRVLENVGVSLIDGQTRRFRNGFEHAEELRSIELPTLLACEQVVGAIRLALTQPYSERVPFVEEGLPAMRVKGLDSLK